MNKQRNVVITNMLWRLMERVGAQGITFIVSIVIARALDPVVYGTVAIVTVFINILQVFVDAGIGTALIQKDNADETDFSSAFFFNIVWSVLLYALLFVSAKYIAAFYERPELVPIIRVLGLNVVISGVKNIEQAVISRRLIFKKFFFSTLGGTIAAAFVGIYMAYNGYGVWALVAQHLVNSLIDTVILWFTVAWRPIAVFSFDRVKRLVSFGWKIFAASLLDTVWNDIRQLIIGKKYTSEDLAYYNKGSQFPQVVVTTINSSLDSVLLPVMSQMQNEKKSLKEMTQKTIKVSSFLIWPMMVGLAACARPLVILLLTEKWMETVPYLQIFCLLNICYPMYTTNLNVIKSLGHSELILRLEIERKIIDAILIFSSIWFGVKAMAMTSLLGGIINIIINSWNNKKLIDYGFADQIKDILPFVATSLVMFVCVMAVDIFHLTPLWSLLVKIPVGALVYFGISYAVKNECLLYIINTVITNKGRKD